LRTLSHDWNLKEIDPTRPSVPIPKFA
jgi:hypothetical protein